MFFLPFFAFLGFSFFFKDRFKNLPSFLITCLFLPVILFFAGYFGLLFSTKILLIFLGNLFIIYYLFQIMKEKNWKKASEHIFFLIAFLPFFLKYHRAVIWGWDEFFWGLFTKSLFDTGHFYTSYDAVLTTHARYIPGIPLLQYFFQLPPRFQESHLFLANSLLILSCLMVPSFFIKKRFYKLGAFLMSLLLWSIFSPDLAMITVDGILGLLLGVSFLVLFSYPRLNFSYLMILLMGITLFKETGLIISASVALIYCCFQLFSNWKFLNFIQSMVLCFFFVLIPNLLWKTHLKKTVDPTAVSISADDVLNPHNLIHSTFGTYLDRSLTISNRFLDAFKNQQLTIQSNPHLDRIFFHGSTRGWLLFAISCLLLSYFISQKAKSQRQLYAAIFVSLFAGVSVWMGLHLLSYLTIIPDIEGMQLASFARYMMTVTLGLSLFSTNLFWSNSIWEAPREQSRRFLAGLILICLFFVLGHTKNFLKEFSKPLSSMPQYHLSVQTREGLSSSVEWILKNTPPESKIWLIYQGSNGYHAMLSRLLISPRKMSDWFWSLGLPYTTDDLWTAHLSHQDFLKQFQEKKYTHLWLENVDDNFWKHYKELFSPSTPSIHKIFHLEQTPNGLFFVPTPTKE